MINKWGRSKKELIAVIMSFLLVTSIIICDFREAVVFAMVTNNVAITDVDEAADVTSPGGIDVTSPGGIDVTSPGGIDVTSPGGIDVTSPGGIDVTSPGGIDVTSPGGIDVTSPGGIDVTSPGGIEVEPTAEFQITSPEAITYDPINNTYVNTVVSSITPSSITYSITSGSGVALIDETSGVVTFSAAGIITVSACIDYEGYDPINIQYSLTIMKALQSSVRFKDIDPLISYGEEYQNTILDILSVGTITYEVTEGNEVVLVDLDGKLHILGVGTAKVKAIIAADDCYEEATASYTITVDKAKQTKFGFEKDEYVFYYGIKNISIVPIGGIEEGKITYSVASNRIATIDENTGNLTFLDSEIGKVTLTAHIEGNSLYEEAYASCEVNVTRCNFPDNLYRIEGEYDKELSPGGIVSWYTSNVKIIPDNGYSISYYDKLTDEDWEEELVLNYEGKDKINFYLKNNTTGSISNIITTPEIKIDKTNPEGIHVEYPIPNLVVAAILFYTDSTIIDIAVTDNESGIKQIEYTYKVKNEVKKEVIDASKLKYSNENKTASASIFISSKFRSKIDIVAVDNAGRKTSLNGEKEIVTDNIAPVIEVKYDNNTVVNDYYYNKNRVATIKIKESNFYAEDVVIEKSYRIRPEQDYIVSYITPTFMDLGDDVYEANVICDEDGEYLYKVSYKDKTNNEAEPYHGERFIIDTLSPKLEVNYNQLKNPNNFFDKYIETSVSITDNFFDLSDLSYEIVAKDYSKALIEVKDLEELLNDITNWKKEGDTYSIKLPMNYDGKVSIKFDYQDKASNQVNYIDQFDIDTKAPTGLLISYSTPTYTSSEANKSYKYYKDNIVVTLSGSDNSGVDCFEYFIIDEISKSTKSYIVEGKDITYSEDGVDATSQFEISNDFNGSIAIDVYDKSGNKTHYEDDTVLVRDSSAPIIRVNFSDSNDKTYYNKSRRATITIEELNFVSSDVNILVRTINGEGNPYSVSISGFTDNGSTHVSTVDFTEDGKYLLEVSYTDKSGNSGSTYSSSEFCIDKKPPLLSVSYDNNNVYNEHFFKAKRSATITVTEKNFDIAQLFVSVTQKDESGKIINNDSILQRISRKDNWTISKESHSISIEFAQEGYYEVSISCNDNAGNSNSGVSFGNSVATNSFVIDLTKPTGKISMKQFNKTWSSLLYQHNFDLFTNQPVAVEIEGEDLLCGVGDIAYYKSDQTLSQEELDKVTSWQIIDTNNFYMIEEDKVIVYARIRDKVENTTYLSSNGVIIDYKSPSIEQMAPAIQIEPVNKNASGIYQDDVGINISISDVIVRNKIYSGIKVISYEVLNCGKLTQSGILFNAQAEQLGSVETRKVWTKSNAIIVDKDKNNSNEVEVRVTAVDHSGNVNTKNITLKIDITQPEIYVTYDNNKGDEVFGSYFKDNRTATISIKERNFDSSLVELILQNVDGSAIPSISEWKKVTGKVDNLDDTTYTATIIYQQNGHYKFDISLDDLAKNKSKEVTYLDSTFTNDFIIDKTLPEVSLLFDNNNAENGEYYKNNRTATVVVQEHNFDPNRFEFIAQWMEPDQSMQTLEPGNWSSNGDTHTLTFLCNIDGYYNIHCSFTDMAGNRAQSSVQSSFFIDKTQPELAIEGVINQSANSGKVAPIITYSDENLENQQVEIKLVGQRRGDIEIAANQIDITNGKIIQFMDFDKTIDNDDYYTLTVSLRDKAGNETHKQIDFSINRFGSTYKLSSSTNRINGSFIQEGVEIVITEVNVDPLDDTEVILYKNNMTIKLVKDSDYYVVAKQIDQKYYYYDYVISKDNFKDDGVYRIVIQSKDKAGNISLSSTDEKNLEVSFGIDKTKPIIIVTNLESQETYSMKQLTVACSVNDNLKTEFVSVSLDGNEIERWENPGVEELKFIIPGDSTKAHTIQIVATDAAGNSTVEEIKGVFVTTNLWVQYYNNKELLYGSVVGGSTISGSVVLAYILRKRKKTRLHKEGK